MLPPNSHTLTIVRFIRQATLLTYALLPSVLKAEIQIFDFNDGPPWEHNFKQERLALWQYETIGGIDNSPWVVTEPRNNSLAGMLVLTEPFSGDQNKFVLGINFYWRGQATGSLIDAITLGIGQAVDDSYTFIPSTSNSDELGPESAQQLQMGVALTQDLNFVTPRGGQIIDQERSFFRMDKEAVQLNQDSWYYLEVQFERAIVNTGYDITLNLYESDSTGRKGDLILSGTTTQYNISLVSGKVHAFIAARSIRYGNIAGVDNFSLTIAP